MSEEARQLIRQTAAAVTEAWAPSLTGIALRWQSRVPDWERVFPGLVALIGMQTLLWPHWLRLTDGSSPLYVAPSTEAGQLWRFAFCPAGPGSAWAFAAGPGSAGWEATLAALTHDNVNQTLATLDARGKVITYGQATARLRPLQGDIGKGDQTLALPLCDCSVIAEMYPEWRDGIAAMLPLLSEAVQRLLTLDPHVDPALAYADLAWDVWDELQRRGCIVVGQAVEKRGIARLFAKPERYPFLGVLILRGDHFALWEQIGTPA